VLKERNYEELNKQNLGAISWCCDTILLAERHVFEKTKSWHDSLYRGTILRRILNTN